MRKHCLASASTAEKFAIKQLCGAATTHCSVMSHKANEVWSFGRSNRFIFEAFKSHSAYRVDYCFWHIAAIKGRNHRMYALPQRKALTSFGRNSKCFLINCSNLSYMYPLFSDLAQLCPFGFKSVISRNLRISD